MDRGARLGLCRWDANHLLSPSDPPTETADPCQGNRLPIGQALERALPVPTGLLALGSQALVGGDLPVQQNEGPAPHSDHGVRHMAGADAVHVRPKRHVPDPMEEVGDNPGTAHRRPREGQLPAPWEM